jgi:hypothetical protein
MKAQLYKMTLYICDLEDSLSLDEIETLIQDRALNGVAVNCVCHFADRHIGKQVEWDDDIDLNRCDCPTSAWDKYFTPPKTPKTNADRIRAMTDEELAETLVRYDGVYDVYRTDGEGAHYDWVAAVNEELEWLQQPAEGDCHVC